MPKPAEAAPDTTPAPVAPTVDDHAALVAELNALPDDGRPAPAEPPEGPTDPADSAEPAEPSELSEEEAPEGDSEEPEAPPKPAEPETDPGLAKRLDAIHRAERRAKEAVAKERQALELERKEWSSKFETAKQFEQLQARAKVDPVSVLRSLGVSEADFEYLAQQIWWESPAGQKDPVNRDRALKARQEREHTTELSKTQHELQALRQQLEAEKIAALIERRKSDYLDAAASQAGDDTPLVKNWLAKAPQKARERLYEVADYLCSTTGEVPDHKQVLLALEKARRAELEELGVDLSAIGKTTKQSTPAAGERRTARTLSNDLGTPTPPRSAPKSHEEVLADVQRALEEGRLD